jgi:hypothetical protein
MMRHISGNVKLADLDDMIPNEKIPDPDKEPVIHFMLSIQ